MKKKFVHISMFIFILSACTGKSPRIATFDLKTSDYLEIIDVPGTIQAVNNSSIVTPRVNVSNLKVVHLAEEGTYVKKGDTICIIEAADLLRNFELFNTDLQKMEAQLRSLVADNEMQLSLLVAQIETNNARKEISMLDSIQVKFAPPVKQMLLALEMEKVNIEKKKLQKKLAARKRIDNSELVQIGSRIMMQKNRIQMFQNQINSLKIVSPCDGFVMHTEGPTFRTMGGSTLGGKIAEGSSVFPNMALLQIPDVSKMQVSVEVPETDYKRISNNQKVLIQVGAATNLQTTGKVIRKSIAGKKPNEQTAIKTYEVIISVDSCHLMMKPGLSASCRIIIENVKDTIVIPSTALFVKDSLKIVYVATGEEFIPVTVETGLSGNSKSIISKGLTGNETIALMEPPHNMIKKVVKSIENKTISTVLVKKDSVIK